VADRLITPEELISYLQQDVDADLAALLVETATGVVQRAARQRLVQATDDATLSGGCSVWLRLPERPVTAVSAVTVDGSPVTDYRRLADRLWRGCGWYARPISTTGLIPPWSDVVVANTHGWPAGAGELQTARSYVLGLCTQAASNPTRIEALAIDDYRESRGQLADQLGMSLTREHVKALRRAYGRRIGSVSV
jgi:hypothetical protein